MGCHLRGLVLADVETALFTITVVLGVSGESVGITFSTVDAAKGCFSW